MESAVVSASEGAIASLLEKLGDLLTDKYKLLKEAKEQIMFFKPELENMHTFLKKMSDVEEHDEQDKCWMKEVRELSYDIEDSITEFLHRVERESNSKPHGFKGFIDRITSLWTTINTRHEIAKEFQGLKRRVTEVSERRTRYKVDGTVSKANNTTIDRRVLALYAETAGLVGVDGPSEELIQLMHEQGVPTHQVKVLSIVGFGGLGKTTLANVIFRKLEGHFQCRAIVSVSQKPNIRRILRTVLSQVGFVAPQGTNLEMWEEPELISALQKFLLNKRYFIVLDDIWDDSAWYTTKCSLPENNNDSRLIITTRIESVARVCCTDHPDYVYKLKPLSDQESRRLFFRRIFGSDDAWPPYLEEVSTEVLRKCGGLPLAIVTTSSLLASQPRRQEWWNYVRNSLGSNLEVSSSWKGMRQILNLSYINLPYYLKSCMLYLGIYPEDYVIKKDDVVRQWVAEGFISRAHGTDPGDVAKIYFNELINRSMVQPADTDYNSEVTSCRVHDMMLDLILQKSREVNFITLIDDIQAGQPDKIRRLSAHLDVAVNDHRVMGPVQQIRTVAIFGTSSYLPSFSLFKHLRVLAIELSEGAQTPLLDLNGICHLSQLRYIKIVAIFSDVVLPRNIGCLQQLETFHLKTQVVSSSNHDLPLDIFHLSRLFHLIVPEWKKLPTGTRNMKSLRTLHYFDLGTNSVDDIKGLGELTNLTNLRIGHQSFSDDVMVARGREVLRTCLQKLCNLKYLYWTACCPFGCWDSLSSVPASFCHLQKFHGLSFLRAPEWIGQLHNLCDLKLFVKEVLEDDVRMLAQLPCLTNLNLSIGRALKSKIIFRGSGLFPVLKHFWVSCSRISYLTFETGAMAKLESLELEFNAMGWDVYGAAPAGINCLLGLKEVSAKIWEGKATESNKRAAESALKNAADMHPSSLKANIEYCGSGSVRMAFDDECSEDENHVSAALEGQMPAGS